MIGRAAAVLPSLAMQARGPADGRRRYTAVGIMSDPVAGQRAAVRGAVIGDGQRAVGCDHVDIEIDQPLATDRSACGSHAVRSMAGGAAETGVDVIIMVVPAGVLHDLVLQIMALAAKRIRPVYAQVGIRKQVRDELTGHGGLAELIAAFENVCPA